MTFHKHNYLRIHLSFMCCTHSKKRYFDEKDNITIFVLVSGYRELRDRPRFGGVKDLPANGFVNNKVFTMMMILYEICSIKWI